MLSKSIIEEEGPKVCTVFDPTASLLRSDGQAITIQRSLVALQTCVSASRRINDIVTLNFPYLIGINERFLARVNPVTNKVFGVYKVNTIVFKGVMTAATEGIYYLEQNIGMSMSMLHQTLYLCC